MNLSRAHRRFILIDLKTTYFRIPPPLLEFLPNTLLIRINGMDAISSRMVRTWRGLEVWKVSPHHWSPYHERA
jgi:hypothetical protein